MSSGHGSKESGTIFIVEELKDASSSVFSFLGMLLLIIFAAVPFVNDQIIEDHLEASGGGGGDVHH